MKDTIDDLTKRATRWIALEGLLFETLGRWARELPEPAVKRTLATWCHRHAWHADLWRARLPVIPHHEVGDDAGNWIKPLRDVLAGVGSTADALDALSAPILQALETALAEHRDALDPRLDGPTARVLDLVATDLEREGPALRALRSESVTHEVPHSDQTG